MTPASPHFDAYRAKHDEQPPDLQKQRFADEVHDLSGNADVGSVVVPPVAAVLRGEPRRDWTSRPAATHIWLVLYEDVRLALEEGTSGRTTARGRLAHTNLSGGSPAFAGGELWFRDESSVWLTGGSGRYPPRSAEELDDLSAAYRAAGFTVCCAGWDSEIAGPARIFRGDDVWR